VSLNHGDGVVKLTVADDGAGFDAEAERVSSFGMRSLRERSAALGGAVTIRSAAGDGTVVTVTLPLQRPAAEPTDGAAVAEAQRLTEEEATSRS
jgi:NarL family two-component system sensor histidine kinase LiaS